MTKAEVRHALEALRRMTDGLNWELDISNGGMALYLDSRKVTSRMPARQMRETIDTVQTVSMALKHLKVGESG